jgi:hypothetical protein
MVGWLPENHSKSNKQSGETHLTGGKMTVPKPRITEDLSSMIHQCNVVVNYAEEQGDLRLMIQAMAERAELYKQAVEESIKWYKLSLTTADK